MQTKKETVIIYSTPSCPYCKMAKSFLKEKNISYKDIDVSEDKQAAKEMIEKSGQMGVPVFEIGNKIIVGFDRVKLQKELNI